MGNPLINSYEAAVVASQTFLASAQGKGVKIAVVDLEVSALTRKLHQGEILQHLAFHGPRTEERLCRELNLFMVEVPLIVSRESGVNDYLDRDGSRTPIEFVVLRHQATLASCAFGGHAIWWSVEAAGPEEALALLPVDDHAGGAGVVAREDDDPLHAPGPQRGHRLRHSRKEHSQ